MAKNNRHSKQSDRRTRTIAATTRGLIPRFVGRRIKTSDDFKAVFSDVIIGTLNHKIRPQVTNAASNAGGKLLQVVKMEYEYGDKVGPNGAKKPKALALTA